MLRDEIRGHDNELEKLITVKVPALITSHGIATMTASEMLILLRDDPTRIRSEAALAKLCGVCPPSLQRQDQPLQAQFRQAYAALYRAAIVRKRTKESKSKKEIIRCFKRYIVREIFTQLCRPKTSTAPA